MSKKPFDTDVEFIQALAAILAENDLTELQVKRDYGEGDVLSVRVSRGKVSAAAPVSLSASAPQPPATPQTPQPSEPVSAAGAFDDPSAHPGAVTSPMVGTAYLSAEPGEPAFVAIGDRVTEGQTLLIVEAMKTMNHIPAPRSGTVRRILIEDGAPVEYGSPLMIVD